MDGLLFLIACGLAVACWWLWNERKQYLLYKSQAEHFKAAFSALQMESRDKEDDWSVKLHQFQQREAQTSKALSLRANELSIIGDMFLPSLSVKGLLGRMTSEGIEAASIPLSGELQRLLTQLAAQKGEAISTLDEALLRLALGVRYLLAIGAINPQMIEYAGEHLQLMMSRMQAQAPLLDKPGYREEFIYANAVMLNRARKVVLNGEEPPPAQMVELLTLAFQDAVDEAVKKTKQGQQKETGTATAEDMAAKFSNNGHSRNGAETGAKAHE